MANIAGRKVFPEETHFRAQQTFIDPPHSFCLNSPMALTNKDLDNLTNLIRLLIQEEVPSLVRAELGKYPNKDEHAKMQDEMMVELQTIRENQEIQQSKIEEHDERLGKLESHPALAAS